MIKIARVLGVTVFCLLQLIHTSAPAFSSEQKPSLDTVIQATLGLKKASVEAQWEECMLVPEGISEAEAKERCKKLRG